MVTIRTARHPASTNPSIPATYEDAVAEILRLRVRVAELEAALEASERAAKRQAAPHSRNAPKRDPKRPGRKPGEKYGTRAFRQPPGWVDETIDVPLPDACPDCGGRLVETKVGVQHQEDLPKARPYVTCYRVHVGHCSDCGRRVQPRHSTQTSAALGAAGTSLGPRAVALAAWLHTTLGVSHAKCAQILEQFGGLKVTGGGLVGAIARAARVAEPTYHALRQAVAASPMVAPDETGWRVGGRNAWMWTFATSTITVYTIADNRSFSVVKTILTETYAGIVCRDGWVVYRSLKAASHQTCYAHLLRRTHHLIEKSQAGQARIPHAVHRLLTAALALRDRRDTGTLKPGELDTRLAELNDQADVLCARVQVTHPPNIRLLNHLERERDALFTFLDQPGVDATNYRAEQAIRPVVVNRKQWGGNLTWVGAHTTETLHSVLRTAHQQQHDPVELLANLLRAPRGSVAPLQLTIPGPAP